MFDSEIFMKIFDKAPLGALVCDGEGFIMYANEKACSITGYPFIEIAGRDIGTIIMDICPDKVEKPGIGKGIREILKYTHRDGTHGLLRVTAVEAGKDISVFHFEDCSDEIRENEERSGYIRRLELAERTGGTGSWEIDLLNGKVYTSEETNRLFGISGNSKVHDLDEIFNYVREADKLKSKIQEISSLDEPGDMVFSTAEEANGEDRILHATGIPVSGETGVECIIGAVIDITERTLYENMLMMERNKFQQYLDIAGFIIIVLDITGRVIVANRKCCEILGLSEDEAVGKSWIGEFIPTKHREEMEVVLKQVMETGKGDKFEYTNPIVTKSGEIRLIHWNSSVVRNDNGDVTGILASGEDITEKTRIETALEQSERSLKEAELITKSGHFEKDLITGTIKWSEGMYCIMGTKPDSDEIDCETELSMMTPESVGRYEEAFHDAFRGDGRFSVEIEARTFDDRDIVLFLRGVLEKEGRTPVRLMGTCQDITGRKEHQDKIEHLSYHDHLTGLYNRRFLEEEFARLDVPRNQPLSVIMADVNGLKLANDSFGHTEGDNLLKNTAGILKKVCRDDDIIARVGGDEFMILLPATGQEDTKKIAERIRKSKYSVSETKLPVSIAIGHATKTDEKQDMDDLFKVAEDAMYRKKLDEKSKLRSNTIKIIAEALFENCTWEREHAERVSGICGKIGKAMKLPKSDMAELMDAGYYHDIGKVAVREDLLLKKQSLTASEMENVRRHSETGYRILSSANETADLAEYVLSHHESWNGTGYPRGLPGIKIPLKSRIIAVAEDYDYMTNKPAGKRSFPKRRAFAEIRKDSGVRYDPQIFDIFAKEVYPKL